MKFTIEQPALQSAIAGVLKGVPSRPSHPILSNLLLRVEGNQLEIQSCDLTQWQSSYTRINSIDGVDSSFCVSAILLNNTISKLPDGPLSIEVEDGERILIKSGKSKYKLSYLPATDWPAQTQDDGQRSIALPADVLRLGCNVAGIASDDETKQILTGVKVAVTADSIEFGATDGHRLAVQSKPLGTVGESEARNPEDLVIPGHAMRWLQRAISTNSLTVEDVNCTIEGTHYATFITFAIESEDGLVASLRSRLLHGQFPNYRQLIPSQFEIEATIAKLPMLKAIERMMVLAARKNNSGVFRFLRDKAFLAFDSVDGSGSEEFGCDCNDTIDIAFNLKYLAEALKGIDADTVILRMNQPNSPAVLIPEGEQEGECIHLVMPIQIRDTTIFPEPLEAAA